jgi:cytochrome c-type biogenesis protein CcmF
MRDVYALISYTLAGFVAATIVQEFVKGTRARRTIHGEALPLALVRLIGRNRRRYGGYVVHLGIVVLFSAFAGLAFKKENDVTLRPGESFTTRDPWGHEWRFVSQGVSRFDALNRDVVAIGLDTWRDGKRVGVLTSEQRQYRDSRGNPTFNPSTEVGILGSLKQDTYVVLAGVTGDETAELRISFNPLVWWVWFGGGIMAFGGLIVMWPAAEKRRPNSGYRASLAPNAELVEAGQ